MKFNAEIEDEFLDEAVRQAVRAAVESKLRKWSTSDEVKKAVNAAWDESLKRLVVEVLTDLPAMREMVVAQVQAKLRGQINAAMKAMEKSP